MNEQTTTIDLSSAERELLAELLDRDFRDLKQEIGSTEDFDYREGLKERRDVIASVLEKLGTPIR